MICLKDWTTRTTGFNGFKRLSKALRIHHPAKSWQSLCRFQLWNSAAHVHYGPRIFDIWIGKMFFLFFKNATSKKIYRNSWASRCLIMSGRCFLIWQYQVDQGIIRFSGSFPSAKGSAKKVAIRTRKLLCMMSAWVCFVLFKTRLHMYNIIHFSGSNLKTRNLLFVFIDLDI